MNIYPSRYFKYLKLGRKQKKNDKRKTLQERRANHKLEAIIVIFYFFNTSRFMG